MDIHEHPKDVSLKEDLENPITLSILWSRLLSIVDEAGVALQRTAFSTITRESNDFAIVLMDRYGQSLVQSSISVPSFLGVLPLLTKALLAKDFPSQTWNPGDVVITNDPWLCAGHKPDIGLVSPIFHQNQLVAFIGSIAHSPDMGGSLWGAGGRDLYEEGLMIPPTKLYEAGKPNDTLYRLIEANVRTPIQTIGDIRAQLSANEQGARSLLALMAEMNVINMDDLAHLIQDISERAMREAINQAPNGTYCYSYDADGDGLDEPVHIEITITIKDDEIHADYTGTSGIHSLALNAVMNYVYAYTAYPIKCAFSPEIPNNEGAFKPITVTAPRGSLLNAQLPAPLGARNITGNMLHALVFGALAQAVPHQVQADCGCPAWSVVLSGKESDGRKDTLFVESFFLNGGYAARPDSDGINTLSFPTNVANVPIEVMENHMPILFLEKSLRTDTGGRGKYRGGLGQTVVFEMVGNEPINMSILTEKTKTQARGICGGENGGTGSIYIHPDRPIPPKGLTKLHPGERVILNLPGAGGYGNYSDRNPEAIKRDIELGYISVSDSYTSDPH